MNNANSPADSHDGFERIEKLIGEVEQCGDPAMLARVRELVQGMLDYHAAGVGRVVELLRQSHGPAAIDCLADDELAASLLLLYDQHPWDLQTRVEKALDKVRPYLQSHGGSVELLGIHGGVASLRLQGSCHGCPSSAMTMRTTIEKAIYAAAPDILEIAVEGLVPAAADRTPMAFVPLEAVVHCNG